MPSDRTPPHSAEAEQATLGSLLIDPDAILRVRHLLQPSHFYREKDGWIYESMLALHDSGEPIDFLTVCDELERRGQIDQVGGPAYIMGLINAVPTSVHLDTYARSVVSYWNKRQLALCAQKVMQLAYNGEDDIGTYTEALKLMQECSPTGKPVEVAGGKQIGSQAFRVLMAEKPDEDGYEPTWPWDSMRRMARWRKGQPVGLIAEGGAGKTTFCMTVAAHNAINGGRVFYAATEDEPSVLLLRQLSAISGVPFRQLETGKFQTENLITISLDGVEMAVPRATVQAARSMDEAWKGELFFVPVSGKTMPEIIYDLQRLEMDVGYPDAIIFDWFLDQTSRPKMDTVIGLTTDLKDLKAHCHHTRLLVATQTGKGGAGKRLTAYDAFWTSAFAHYCKIVLSLKRERELVGGEAVGAFKPEVEAFISKANLDQTGLFKLHMRGESFQLLEPEMVQVEVPW